MNDRPTSGGRFASDANADETMPPARVAAAASITSSARRGTPRWLALALGVVAGVALVIMGVAFFSRLSEASSPPVAPIARQICDDLTNQRYDDFYGLLSSAEQAVGTRDQFVASQRQLDAQLGAAHTCAYTVSSQDASSANITLTLTRGTASSTPAQVRLTLEQTVWRISDYDSSLVKASGNAI
ncbi:MAG TPA: hypothetical protein VJR48_15970 [Ktedonobacterales bacterium]|nr:hypothetical protein [Ktedonobacterales bacterium]